MLGNNIQWFYIQSGSVIILSLRYGKKFFEKLTLIHLKGTMTRGCNIKSFLLSMCNHSSFESYSLFFHALESKLLYKCFNQQEVISFDFQDQVVRRLVASTWSLGTLTLGEANHHRRSPTTLRMPCCEETQHSHVKRTLEREMSTSYYGLAPDM